jgi:Holliday junction resolvasome RuvABC endonuclease subunit
MMVCGLLQLEEPIESEDASDALAVAICHATHAFTRRRLAGALK